RSYNASIETALNESIKGLPLSYKIIDRTIVVRRADEINGGLKTNEISSNNQQSVQGIVTDEKGLPIPGVSVRVKGTTVGTVTDANGLYALESVNENAILVFSFIGFVSKEININGQTRI